MKRAICLFLAAVMLMPAAYAAPDTAFSNSVGLSVSIVNQNPDPAPSGTTFEVRLGVANTGGKAASNIMIELLPAYPFTIVPGDSPVQSVGTILGYQGQYDNNQKIVRYKLQVDKNAAAGNYTFKVRTYDSDSLQTLSQNTLSAYVTSKARAEVARIDNSVLVPGEQSSLKFTIDNVGSAPLSSLTFNWANANGIILPVGSDNTRYVKYIDVGDSAEMEYQVIADTNAVAGLYKLDLQLAYADPATGAETKVSTVAGVYVGGGTDFEVAFSDSSSGQTSFTIANIGSNPATSVSVSIPEQRGWTISGASASIIGNLNKGDYTVASFNLQPPANASGYAPNNRTRGGQQRNFTGMQAANVPPRDAQMNATGMQAGNSPSRDAQMNFSSMPPVPSNTVRIQIAYTDTMGARKTVEKEVKLMDSQGISAAARMAGTTGRTTAQTQSSLVQYQWYIIGIGGAAILLMAYRRRESHNLRHVGLEPGDTYKKAPSDRKK